MNIKLDDEREEEEELEEEEGEKNQPLSARATKILIFYFLICIFLPIFSIAEGVICH